MQVSGEKVIDEDTDDLCKPGKEDGVHGFVGEVVSFAFVYRCELVVFIVCGGGGGVGSLSGGVCVCSASGGVVKICCFNLTCLDVIGIHSKEEADEN